MNAPANEQMPALHISKVRQFLFWCLAVVWFSEMLFLGFPFLNRIWLEFWKVTPPEESQLATASMITGAVGAPVKGALFVMAAIALKSINPSIRTPLFVSMSLVPPFNVAMPFRFQGFIPGPTTVGITLSIILWLSFFLFRERNHQHKQYSDANTPSGQENFQYILLALTSALLTILAVLFLFFPKAALRFSFPCIPGIQNASPDEQAGMIYHSMASGTHLLALSIGSWIATINFRRNPGLRQAMTYANIVFIVLFFVFPMRQAMMAFGISCLPLPAFYSFTLLLAGWLIYLASSAKQKTKTTYSYNKRI